MQEFPAESQFGERVSAQVENVAVAEVQEAPFVLRWDEPRLPLLAAELHLGDRVVRLAMGSDGAWAAAAPDPLPPLARIAGVLGASAHVEITELRGRSVRVPPWAATMRFALSGPVERPWSVSLQPVVAETIEAAASFVLPSIGAAVAARFRMRNFEEVLPGTSMVFVAPIGSVWAVQAQCDEWRIEPNGFRMVCPGEVVLSTTRHLAGIRVRAPDSTVIALYRGDDSKAAVSERKATAKGALPSSSS